jgi:hypothetical protein
MKILKIIGIIVVVLILIVVGYGLSLSGEAQMERSTVIYAPVEKVFNSVNTFANVKEWSPWMKIDPDVKIEFSGPEYGTGAKYSWASEMPELDKGTQEILESSDGNYVKTQMVFAIPGEFYAEYILEPADGGTKLTWTYDGKVEGLMWKILMSGTEAQLGPMYEQGLADLKTYIESLPDPEPEEAMEVEEPMEATSEE